MKKTLFLAAAAALTISTTVSAQVTPATLKSELKQEKKEAADIKSQKKEIKKELKKLTGNDVSYQAKQAFARDFGDIPVISSERLDNYDEFTFSKDGQTISAFYDWYANLVGTTQNKTFEDLPKNAQENIKKQFKDYTPGDVVFFDDNEQNDSGMILYGNKFEDTDSYFVELEKANKKIVVHVRMNGDVAYYTRLK